MAHKRGENPTGVTLFYCETKHVLLNYLVLLHSTELKGKPVDLILTDMSDWGEIPAKLEATGLFQNIYLMETRDLNTEAALWDEERIKAVAADPLLVFPKYPRERSYSDVWFNLPNLIMRMFYYGMLGTGSTPAIHLIEEGTASYAMNLNCTSDALDRSFGNKSFDNKLDCVWLYRPEMWSGGGQGYSRTIEAIDSSVVKTPELQKLLLSLMKPSKLPKQRYIYCEECYIRNRHTVNDLGLLEQVADVVGIENIAVRLHPKSEADRFTPFGFHVEENDGGSWELMCLLEDMSDKVLLTVKSSTVFTPVTFGLSNPYTVLFKTAVTGEFPNRRSGSFANFLDKVRETSNTRERRCFIPGDTAALMHDIDYIEYLIAKGGAAHE